MHILYFDEAGCTAKLPTHDSPITPVLVITGLIIPVNYLPYITREFMDLKKKFFFNKLTAEQRKHHSNWIKAEIKGADLRKTLAKDSRNNRRPITLFLKNVCKMIQRYECKVISKVFIKGIGRELNGISVYTSSIQMFHATFQEFLTEQNSKGLIIGDSRDAGQNSLVSHGIFSKKTSTAGDAYDRIIDMPSFAHSENSAGLQLADLLASAIVWPIAIESFCKSEIKSVHIRNYAGIKKDFLENLRLLEYRKKENDKYVSGIYINNRLNKRKHNCFFRYESEATSENVVSKKYDISLNQEAVVLPKQVKTENSIVAETVE